MDAAKCKAENYYSKDFNWDQLKKEIEGDPSFLHHLLPFTKKNENKDKQLMGPSTDEDSEAWNQFHARHSTGKFFKERRYLLKEFPELASCIYNSKVLEVGCGNGSTALPILRGKEDINVYACDCSNEALDRAKDAIACANLNAVINRFHPFLCDVSTCALPKWLACDSCRQNFCRKQDNLSVGKGDIKPFSNSEENRCCIGGVDFVTLIFTLSAIPPHRMSKTIQECFSVLKPGGLLLFRDYGLLDMTMLRFGGEQRVGDREYLRPDGTRSYFFSLEFTRDLFSSCGFIELELEYCCVKSINRLKGKTMLRVWVHGKFQKPCPERSRDTYRG